MNRYRYLLFSLAAALLITALLGAGALKREDRWAQDWLFQRPGVTSPKIVIVGIDDEAFNELGPYQTWDRNIIASALETLAADPENRPAVTTIDVLYVGNTSPQADERLAAAAQELGNVVTACMAEYGQKITWENGIAVSLDTSAVIGFEQPYEELRNCTTQGHINAMNDTDGVLRHSLLYVETDAGNSSEDSRIYSMAYRAVEIYAQQHDLQLQLPAVSESGHFYLPFTGRPGDYYDGISIARIINNEIPASYWADKIVLIGPYAAALQDSYFTAIDKGVPMYGVEVQANVIQCLLEGNSKTELPASLHLTLFFILFAAVMFLLLNMKVIPGAAVCAGVVAVGPSASRLLYQAGWITHPLWLPAGAAFMYVLALCNHYIRASREKQALALEKERISAELELASRIQVSVLPKEFPPFPDRREFDLYASMTPAKEVGGDFYDFFLIDEDHLALTIADVSGKGIPAALFMMVSSSLLHHAAMAELSPAKVLETVNRQLCSRNPEEMFVTVWLGILDISTGKLKAANAGHEFPILKRTGESFDLYKDRHGLVLGGMDEICYREYELQLDPGSKLFVYTDGVAEATNSHSEMFGVPRLVDTLRASEDGTPAQILSAVNLAVRDFVGDAPQFDDLTMLCLVYNGDINDRS